MPSLVIPAAGRFFYLECIVQVSLPKHLADRLRDGPAQRTLEETATRLHGLLRLRLRHFVSPVMADNAMAVMLTLFISECQDIGAGEQSIILANHITPFEGAALIDHLVQAGLATATGKTPGRRAVGLTPLGSARMRAYIADYPEG